MISFKSAHFANDALLPLALSKSRTGQSELAPSQEQPGRALLFEPVARLLQPKATFSGTGLPLDPAPLASLGRGFGHNFADIRAFPVQESAGTGEAFDPALSVSRLRVQRKLLVGRVDDPLEREADAVAELAVPRGGDPWRRR